MNIAIETSDIIGPHPTGVAYAGVQLINHLAFLDHTNRYFLCYRLSRIKYKRYFLHVAQENFQTKVLQEPFNFLFMKKISLYHGLAGRLYRSARAKMVVTVYDVPQESNQYSGTRHPEEKIRRYQESLTRADRIIASSFHTKREILQFFPVDGQKIDVVHLGVGVNFRPASQEEIQEAIRRYGIHTPYIFFLGRIELKKNLIRAIEAFSHARKQLSFPVSFVLAGAPGPGVEHVLSTITNLQLEKEVCVLGYLDYRDLPSLYSGAALFLFPSLYEGFGLPVLEAMACGTPVITSNTTSLPEVAGNAACMVAPLDTDAISSAILNVLKDRNLRDHLVQKGVQRATEFSWENAARKTLSIYRKIVPDEPDTRA